MIVPYGAVDKETSIRHLLDVLNTICFFNEFGDEILTKVLLKINENEDLMSNEERVIFSNRLETCLNEIIEMHEKDS